MGKIERDYLNKVDYFSIGSTKSLEDKVFEDLNKKR